MLPTLTLALSLAAPVPKIAPFPLRTDPLPKEFKLADLEDAALPRSQEGKVLVLAWETIEDDRPQSYTKVLTLKKFDQADEKGNTYALCAMWWDAKREEWRYRFVDPTPVLLPGQKWPDIRPAVLHGTQRYSTAPTEKEFATFLEDVEWKPDLGKKEAMVQGGKRTLTTKLAAGGFDRAAWKAHFDRDPPVELFPELKAEGK